MHRRASISPSIARQPRVALLVPPLSDKPDNASTMPRQCVAPLVRHLWDKRRPASPPPQPRNKVSIFPDSLTSSAISPRAPGPCGHRDHTSRSPRRRWPSIRCPLRQQRNLKYSEDPMYYLHNVAQNILIGRNVCS